MTLLEEYINQNKWREWERYLGRLPLKTRQVVYDLGCSMGYVSKLLAPRVKKVVGIDHDAALLEEARRNKPDNCEFLQEDIFSLVPQAMETCDGIWLSFTLAYINEPEAFLSAWAERLSPGGWFAVVDIDGLFSSHLPESGPFFEKTVAFEKAMEQGRGYDFRAGGKIRGLLEKSGLKIVVAEEDWYDGELNFKHRPAPEIIINWASRLERMVSLKAYFGAEYPAFCAYFLHELRQERHASSGGVKFFVGIK